MALIGITNGRFARMGKAKLKQTEMLADASTDLDLRSDEEILATLLDSQKQALNSLDSCLHELANSARKLVHTINQGGRIVYAAAGSSGLMALADAAELRCTFGLSKDSVVIFMAGGIPTSARVLGYTDDDEATALEKAKDLSASDTVLAISASGSTPYTVEFARVAHKSKSTVIGIANNRDAPLFSFADIKIFLDTPPEMVAGSTRLGAATAQKAALNVISTLMGLRLGHVYSGMMINFIADNHKLKLRAEGIVQNIAGTSVATARAALEHSAGNLKQAILVAAGVDTPQLAQSLLDRSDGQLRIALQQL